MRGRPCARTRDPKENTLDAGAETVSETTKLESIGDETELYHRRNKMDKA